MGLLLKGAYSWSHRKVLSPSGKPTLPATQKNADAEATDDRQENRQEDQVETEPWLFGKTKSQLKFASRCAAFFVKLIFQMIDMITDLIMIFEMLTYLVAYKLLAEETCHDLNMNEFF